MSIEQYQVPQDLGPSPHPLNLSDGASYFTSVDYVVVDAFSTLSVDVFWGADVVNPMMVSYEWVNPTNAVMTFDSYELPAGTFELEFTYELERGGPPAWGLNPTSFSTCAVPIPAPGAFALILAAGVVACVFRSR